MFLNLSRHVLFLRNIFLSFFLFRISYSMDDYFLLSKNNACLPDTSIKENYYRHENITNIRKYVFSSFRRIYETVLFMIFFLVAINSNIVFVLLFYFVAAMILKNNESQKHMIVVLIMVFRIYRMIFLFFVASYLIFILSVLGVLFNVLQEA